MDARRRRFLETLAQACERVLADHGSTTDPQLFDLLEDAAQLRDEVRAELAESETAPNSSRTGA